MNYEIYKKFLNKRVCIGMPNWFDTSRLFFEDGYVVEVTSDYLMLRTDNGFKKIPLDDIAQIELYIVGDE